MPEIVVASPLAPFVSALNSASATASTAISLKNQREKVELAKRQQALSEERFKHDVAQAERAQAQADRLRELRLLEAQRDERQGRKRELQEQAGSAFNQDRARLAGGDLLRAKGQGPDSPLAGRLERYAKVLPRLSPANQEKYISEIQKREKKQVIEQGYSKEAQMLQDAVDDGLFEKDPELAAKMAKEIARGYKAGDPPGFMAERIDQLRQTKAEADVRVQGWQEALIMAEQAMNAAQTPEAKRAIKLEMAKAQAPSVQKRIEPDVFKMDIQDILRGEDAFDRGEAVGQRVLDAPGMQEGTQARGQHDALKAQEREQRGFVGQTPKTEGLRSYESFKGPQRKQLAASMKKARTVEELIQFLDGVGLDPESLPEEVVRDLVFPEAAKKKGVTQKETRAKYERTPGGFL